MGLSSSTCEAEYPAVGTRALQWAPAVRPPQRQQRPLFRVGPYGVTLRSVHSAGSHDAHQLRQLFCRIFPLRRYQVDDLSMYFSSHTPPFGDLINHAWLVTYRGEPVGLRLFSYLPQRRIGHGAFVGLLPQTRGMGLGSWLVEQTKLQLAWDAHTLGQPQPLGYCAEVERSEDGVDAADRQIRQQRLQFHWQNGAQLLPVQYWEPDQALWSNSTSVHPMHLVFYAQAAASTITPALVRAVVEGLYCDVYRMPPETALLRQVLQCPSEVAL